MGIASVAEKSNSQREVKLRMRVPELLRARFPGAQVYLDDLPNVRGIGGYLVWDGFDGMEPKDRQRRMWEVFEAEFSEDEMEDIVAILTVTPLGYENIQENIRS